MFEALAVLHQCPVEVICPFSYGGTDTPYASRVRQVAEKAPMRVVLVEELLAPEEFNQLLEDCDILVINSRKQRAMFSIAAYLLMGRPVFLPDDGDLARDLRADGFLIRPLHALASLTCEGLRGLCDHGDPGNREVARQLYSIEPIIAAWSRVLSGV